MYCLRSFTGRGYGLWYSSLMNAPLRILVVDDDPVSREVLQVLLAHAGYVAETAGSGEEALRMGPGYDVVLADLQMPGLRGSALAEALRAAGGPVRLIAMSASVPLEEIEGYDGFLRKPFTVEGLQRLLEEEEEKIPEKRPAGVVPVLEEKTYKQLAASMSPEQLATLYELFLSDARRGIEEIRKAAEADDEEMCRKQAHAIKGSSGMVGAAEVQMIATSIENNRLYAYSRESLEAFLKACDRLEAILAERGSRSVRQ